MKLYSIFKPVYSEQHRECLTMSMLSPIGVRVNSQNGARYVESLQRRCFSFAIINCTDISGTIQELKKVSRSTNILAHLDKRGGNVYNGEKKNIQSSFALLYDFVDAFLISGFDELSDDIDQLINLRMYNDEYRPILMEIPDSMLLADLDNVISYARMSNIDGLLISNKRLLKHASEKAAGALTLIYENAGDIKDITDISDCGAKLYCITSGHNPLGSICKGRKFIRRLHKLFLQGSLSLF